MLERRRHPRREILTLGKVIFNNPLSVINCVSAISPKRGLALSCRSRHKRPIFSNWLSIRISKGGNVR